jgi:hypothetical protein
MADTAEVIEVPQNEVAVQEGQTFDLASPEGLMGALLSAAPGTDTDKLDALAGIYERMEKGRAKQAFARAMAEMQPKLPAVGKGGQNKHLNSNYARLEDIQAAVRPLLSEHGFSYRWICETGEHEINVTCIVTHREGHSESDSLPLPVIDQKGTNRLQQHGVTVSYGKRYTLCNVLGVQLGGEDTDGELPRPQAQSAPQPRPTPTNGRLTKQQAREVFGKMQQGLRSQRSERGVTGWLNAFDEDLQTLPEDWERDIRAEAQQEIEGHRAAETPTEGPF